MGVLFKQGQQPCVAYTFTVRHGAGCDVRLRLILNWRL
jgi:hypothetical protein